MQLLLSSLQSSGQDTSFIIFTVISVVLTLALLLGISMLSKVKTAVKGNLIGAGAVLIAIILTLWYHQILDVYLLWAAILVGGVLGIIVGQRVKMIQMPQLVGLLNGFGGAASMITGILTLLNGRDTDTFSLITAGLAIIVGAPTFSGSMVAAGKLHKVFTQKPIVLKNHQFWTALSLVLALITVPLFALPAFSTGTNQILLIVLACLFSLGFGVLFSIRVGGADMPITISLLNSLTGVASGIAGMAIQDLLLVAVGGIVGASGLLLTQIMCKAMNRKLVDILLGKTSVATAAKKAPAANAPKTEAAKAVSAKESPADWLKKADKVIIVPGYGMALSQAQTLVKQTADLLESMGKTVDFAIHPVAGRMPGHMNVLLAEADVPYDKLREMDDINPEFAQTDVVLVIGANDVVNPAAKSAEGTPIYGMPILDVEDARHIIFLNFDDKPGYAGVDNPLYSADPQKAVLIAGDAKSTLSQLLAELQKTEEEPKTTQSAEKNAPVGWLRSAEKVIIVPGYGMALSQAQTLVKQTADLLESMGKVVDFAIHPVAGRMPGHMNVLLAEADVPYDKLREMDDINPEFAQTDVVLVIGANDVVNPAAKSAEGTPIFGMPILDVEEAKHIIFLNFDDKPGYAGVDNPLYSADPNKAVLLAGDAKESLNKLLAGIQQSDDEATSAPSQIEPAKWLKEAQKVIIVPGYGMALSQAQSLVKQTADRLESMGKVVDFAIHPVAGRMPGHMNVLLAEADVPYDKLREMDDINSEFAQTDVVLVIGANDVVNPAAKSAEGTPIYGMPILDVEDAKHIIFLNFDDKPGYAGVDNPLYTADPNKAILLAGDAKESLTKLLAKL
ncbi:MAG: NAD(P)(+) transhydrogenase (Re/Si-specific) subunit beta [Anaerolineaceae bacterium]|jgi:NAD/NADP transhydrogenase beta subunit